MDQLEEILESMTLPEIKNIRHQELLSKAITGSKRKTALSLWMALPAYTFAMFFMKSFYKRGSGLKDFTMANRNLGFVIFIAVPAVVIWANTVQARRVYKLTYAFKSIWKQILLVILSLIVIIFFLCS